MIHQISSPIHKWKLKAFCLAFFENLNLLHLKVYLQCWIYRIFLSFRFCLISNLAKTTVLELLDSPKLISREIWITKNPEISTLCNLSKPKFLGQFQPSNIAKIHKNQNSEPKNVLKYNFWASLISRKIWVAEKF